MKKFLKSVKEETFDIPKLSDDVRKYGVLSGNKRKRKWEFNLKIRYVMILLVFLIAGFLIIEDNIEYSKYEEDYTVYTVDSKTKLNKIIENNKKYSRDRKSILDLYRAIGNMNVGCSSVDMEEAPNSMETNAFTNNNLFDSGSNSEERPNHSQTNKQEEGVDEAEVVKTDGKFIYVIYKNGKFVIYKVNGENLEVVKEVNDTKKTLDVTYAIDGKLYLTDTKIIVIKNYNRRDSQTRKFVCESAINIYNYQTFELEKFYEFKGNINDSRLINKELNGEKKEFLYIITTDNIDNEPGYFVDDEEVNISYEDVIYMKYSENSFISYIASICLNDFEINVNPQLSAFSFETIYMSENYLYVVTKKYNAKINKTVSTIYAYDVKNGHTDFFGALFIEGTVDSKWYLSEYEGRFRVAFEDLLSPDDTKINKIAVYDINKDNKSFDLVGYLEDGIGLAGQDIKSVLFDKNFVNIVTYANKDPLYRIELVDGTTPVIRDFYESPGYSGYLKKIVFNDIEYLIGLGYTDSGIVKLSLYTYNQDNELSQIGEDYIVKFYETEVFENSAALFFYQTDTGCLYGFPSYNKYALFEINLAEGETINLVNYYIADRCIYIDGYIYLIDLSKQEITPILYENSLN